jgi:hypothetical protein
VFLFDIASPEVKGLAEQQDMFWPVFWSASKS